MQWNITWPLLEKYQTLPGWIVMKELPLPSGIHTQPCAHALLRALLAVLEMESHVPCHSGLPTT